MVERLFKDRLFVGAIAVAMGLMLALSSFSITTARSDRSPKSQPTIADVVMNNPDFEILEAAVTELGLVATLSGNQPFTVFAPTDAAFAELLAELDITPTELLADEGLLDIVLFHVTRGVRQSQSVVGEKSLNMLNGDRAMVSGGAIEGANIVTPDIRTSNGVIHVVDSVLLPN